MKLQSKKQIMKKIILLPQMHRKMVVMGENIKLARLRRKYTKEQVAERAGISLKTLTNVENGQSSVSIGIYLQVLHVLGLASDIYKIAENDILGRKLQDIELLRNKNT